VRPRGACLLSKRSWQRRVYVAVKKRRKWFIGVGLIKLASLEFLGDGNPQVKDEFS
jgi:hypothetical protein